jgi:hypothetical protein
MSPLLALTDVFNERANVSFGGKADMQWTA